jgi:hypothetical protein
MYLDVRTAQWYSLVAPWREMGVEVGKIGGRRASESERSSDVHALTDCWLLDLWAVTQ